LADANGIVRPEIVWAALDCPTAFACDLSGPPIALARLRGRIDQPIPAGDGLVVTAWALGREGRQHHSACAISNAGGELLALSRALWIELKDPATFGAANRPTAEWRLSSQTSASPPSAQDRCATLATEIPVVT
jgi:hypothetical protein